MLDMHARRLPTETEASSATHAPNASACPTLLWLRRRQATAIYVIEGLRTGSPEGRGATAALMRVAREHWHDVPDLNATLRSVCMVADAEFSETTEDMPPFLQEASDAHPAACGARPLLSDPAPHRRLSRRLLFDRGCGGGFFLGESLRGSLRHAHDLAERDEGRRVRPPAQG